MLKVTSERSHFRRTRRNEFSKYEIILEFLFLGYDYLQLSKGLCALPVGVKDGKVLFNHEHVCYRFLISGVEFLVLCCPSFVLSWQWSYLISFSGGCSSVWSGSLSWKMYVCQQQQLTEQLRHYKPKRRLWPQKTMRLYPNDGEKLEDSLLTREPMDVLSLALFKAGLDRALLV